jgi:hypothetical protein
VRCQSSLLTLPLRTSGNPKGRVKVGLSIAELARGHGEEMLAVLVKAARKGSIAAALGVLDRGFGKPLQPVEFRMLMEKKLSELSDEELAVLESRLMALPDEEETDHVH